MLTRRSHLPEADLSRDPEYVTSAFQWSDGAAMNSRRDFSLV